MREAGVIKSAGRVLALFEYFAERRAAATISEIAQALGMPQSSTSMLVKSLVTLGYLDQDVDCRRYLPTLRATLLGDWVSAPSAAGSPVIRRLELIQRETGETILLARQNGVHALYIHIIEASHAVRLHVRAGMARPMTLAATGLALLATRPKAEVRAIARRINAEMADPARRRSEQEVLAKIATIHATGVSEGVSAITPGAAVIAMLIPQTTEAFPLAVGVGGPAERIVANRDRIVAAIAENLAR